MSRVSLAVATMVLGASCSYQGTPVPVSGDTQLLAGEWEGTYSSDQSRRTGSIQFHLKAGTDSAYGDVLMIPERADEMGPSVVPQIPDPLRKQPRVLRISFVRCEQGKVTGTLDPYHDPDTGERILTTFEGRLRGDEFRGTFSTLYPGNGHRVEGTWSVKRAKVSG